MPSPNKYRAKKVVIEGITFDSQKEGNHYLQLKHLQNIGEIEALELQPRFNIDVNGKRCGFYKADFRYTDKTTGEERIVDVKGYKGGPAWSMFRLKKKLVEALYGIEIEVV